MTTGTATTPTASPRSARSAGRLGGGRGRRRLGDLPIALTFVAPALAAAILLRLWPTGRAFIDSLKSTPLGVEPKTWVGLDQYTSLFSDPGFINSLKVTALFGLIINPLQIAVSLALA